MICQGNLVDAKAKLSAAGKTIANSQRIVFHFSRFFFSESFIGRVSLVRLEWPDEIARGPTEILGGLLLDVSRLEPDCNLGDADEPDLCRLCRDCFAATVNAAAACSLFARLDYSIIKIIHIFVHFNIDKLFG